jgi:DNA-binding HxlR family transcriptional regulator
MKSYGQFCPVAKAAELFCDRWTPLILRDLGLGTSRFARLQRGIPRASPTLLSRRLRQLEAEGIIERRRSGTGRSWTYHLTPSGEELVPVVRALGVWGQRWSRRELSDHEVDASLLLWAMQRGARSDAFGARRGVVKLTLSDQPIRKRHYWFISENGQTQLCIEDPGFEADLHVSTTLRDMIYVWRGDVPLTRAQSEGRLEVLGEGWARRVFPTWLARSSYAHIKSQRTDGSITTRLKTRSMGSKMLQTDRLVAR